MLGVYSLHSLAKNYVICAICSICAICGERSELFSLPFADFPPFVFDLPKRFVFLQVRNEPERKHGKWLADKLGMSTCTMNKWRSNTIQPDLNTLDGIVKLLDANVKVFLTIL